MVRVYPIECDRYSRTVAEIFLGETFINAEMVRKGYAWHYPAYSRNCPNRSAINLMLQQQPLAQNMGRELLAKAKENATEEELRQIKELEDDAFEF